MDKDNETTLWPQSAQQRIKRIYELFSYQRKLFLPTDNTDNTKIFFSQQITLITQKKNSCSSCYPLAKEKNQCNPCNLLTKTKKSRSSCYPLAKEKNQCNPCNLLTKTKNSCSSCYPLAKEKNQCNPCNLLTKKALLSSRTTEPGKSKFATYYSPKPLYVVCL